MPNSQQNPPRCKSLLVEEALEYACNSNDAGFSRIRDEVLVHPDRVQVEWAIMDALLMKGFIHLAIDMTDTIRVVAWVDQHAQRLANNPGLLNTWRCNMYKDPGLVAHCLGIIFETLGSQKIALLQDTLGTALGVSGVVRVLHPGRDLTDLLRRDASRWQEMSPIWMGTVGSATRRMATMRGWTPLHLPGMCARHVHRPNAGAWLNRIQYPYSLAMLGCMQAALVGELGTLGVPEVIASADNAKPQDIALALAVIEASPVPLGIRLQPCGQNIASYTGAYGPLKEVVRTHMDLQLMDHLVLSLYRGIFPRLDVSQAIALPNLQ